VSKHIEAYFKYMHDQSASDLHIASGSPPMIRRYGDMVPIGNQALTAGQVVTMMKEIMSVDEIRKLAALKNVDFGVQWNDPGPLQGRRYRGNAYIQKNGPNLCFRAITTRVPSLQDLGLPQDLAKFAHFHQGLILVTGATGSGKSSTMAALINIINETRKGHIITVEDPIEFVHQSKNCLVNQREVGRDVESFQLALKGALREDPDVILVGELRDLETIQLAVTAAETGHVVFGTLHTNSAAKTIDRLIDSFPAEQQSQVRTMLSESLRGVIAQQLVPRADGKGRIAAVEVLVGNLPVANLIREGKTFQLPMMMQIGRAQGMVLMDDYLMDLLKQGLISEEEARARMVGKAQADQAKSGAR
jgi:twitching motility protein PilT